MYPACSSVLATANPVKNVVAKAAISILVDFMVFSRLVVNA
jgi:hypothetical protein